MSERDFEVVPPLEPPLDGRDFEALDPLGIARPPSTGPTPHGPQRGWSWLMYTMGKRAPDNLAKAARYRQAMLKLRLGSRRIR